MLEDLIQIELAAPSSHGFDLAHQVWSPRICMSCELQVILKWLGQRPHFENPCAYVNFPIRCTNPLQEYVLLNSISKKTKPESFKLASIWILSWIYFCKKAFPTCPSIFRMWTCTHMRCSTYWGHCLQEVPYPDCTINVQRSHGQSQRPQEASWHLLGRTGWVCLTWSGAET